MFLPARRSCRGLPRSSHRNDSVLKHRIDPVINRSRTLWTNSGKVDESGEALGSSLIRSNRNLIIPYHHLERTTKLNAPVETNETKRTLFGSSSQQRIDDLSKRVQSDPQDTYLTAKLLEEMNRQSKHWDVIDRYQRGKLPSQITEEIRAEIMTAAVKTGRVKSIDWDSMSQQPESTEKTKTNYQYQIPIYHPPVQQGGVGWKWVFGALLVGVTLGWMLVERDDNNNNKKNMSPEEFRKLGPGSNYQLATNVETKFDDVKGCDAAKEEVLETIEYLRNPEKFTYLGAKLPRGVLLFGPPGTGKTLLARAMAGEAGVPFLFCSGSSFNEIFIGVGPRRVRELFAEARKQSPCIIFIDEIDSVGASRKRNSFSNHNENENTLNQLLTEMDGFSGSEGIIVIAATNRPEGLDEALTRPGRFDKQVNVAAPDMRGRKEILDLYLAKTIVDETVDSKIIARSTSGFTGADLSNLVNLAAIKASMRGLPAVNLNVIEEAKDDVLMGIARKGHEPHPEDIKMTAYHEGGHALVALHTVGAVPLHKATVIQRGNALGVTMQLPERDEVSMSKEQMMASLAVCMGGKAAEELIYGAHKVTSGASSDIQKATQLAYQMVAHWGMSDAVGNVYCDRKEMSEELKKLIDSEVKTLLEISYNYAKLLLRDREHELHNIARALLTHETLTGEEIRLAAKGQVIPARI
eukprot:TRINITY_DN1395_c0_g1_i1.p1 TRINITY_DN1395_c0_g1~~TRINITY_DN1395_c0_g1_i1.p1  ORF type:complete len:693 (-),score=167.19 TRINITY_DN1395_c0_g1_i1:28-2106(-)